MARQVRPALKALGLALPLIAFVLVFFALPIATMLLESVADRVVRAGLPRTLAELARPEVDEATCAALVADLRESAVGPIGKRLSYERSGFSALLRKTARQVKTGAGPWQFKLAKIDARWTEPATWAAIRRASGPLTATFLLAAVDRTRDDTGAIVPVPENRAIFVEILGRTFTISLQVTLLCLMLGYPLAYFIAHQPPARAKVLLLFVLLPFWTSLLVRTTAWIVLLQQQGVLNDLLAWLGFQRQALVYNRIGVLVAMTHVLLPFMVLPLYSVMRGIPPDYVRAARSLGADSWTAFRRIYAPQTLPGMAAGILLVFILAIGYYITPELVGGPRDKLISSFIAQNVNETLNWGLASALGAILFVTTLALYLVFDRVIGVDKLRVS